MPLPWPEIRDKAIALSLEWQDAESERAKAQTFWKGQLVVEHKSRGQDLDRAFVQALDYFPGIADRDLPRYVLVSDFARFRLYDPDTMPTALSKAHDALDRAVDTAYGKKGFVSDAERVAFLIALYEKYTSLLPSQPKAVNPKRKRKSP